MYRPVPLISRPVLFSLVASAVLLAVGGPSAAGQPSESLDQRIDRLIEQLGHDDYFLRERAQAELAELGFDAYDALLAATTHEDPEIAARAKYLLRLIPAQWSAEDEPEEVQRYLTYYQSYPREIRIQALRVLARLPEGIGIPVLCRLVRFEKSTLWSKHAAVAILDWEPVDAAGRARWSKQLREDLGRSGRTAARWLKTHLECRDDPKAAVAQWTKLASEEQAVLERSPDQSDPRILAALWYYLAMAQADQGDRASAEKTAGLARLFNLGKDAWSLDAHASAARALERRGRFPWAELEYRHVIGAGSLEARVDAQLALSEMLHDMGSDLPAADVLRDVLKVDEEELKKILGESPLGRTRETVRGRMSYFYASHWAQQGDRTKERKYLDEAIASDPGELDALIARYQLPDPEPEYHQKTLELIRKAAAQFRQLIVQFADQPIYYNQFAWLVGNTEGDLDEALKYSQKAVKLRPDSGAYLDTLAHVYFARGDLANALKHQTKAAEFEPHSGLITRKLELFRKALEEKRKSPGQTPDEKTPGQSRPPKPPPPPEPPQPEP